MRLRSNKILSLNPHKVSDIPTTTFIEDDDSSVSSMSEEIVTKPLQTVLSAVIDTYKEPSFYPICSIQDCQEYAKKYIDQNCVLNKDSSYLQPQPPLTSFQAHLTPSALIEHLSFPWKVDELDTKDYILELYTKREPITNIVLALWLHEDYSFYANMAKEIVCNRGNGNSFINPIATSSKLKRVKLGDNNKVGAGNILMTFVTKNLSSISKRRDTIIEDDNEDIDTVDDDEEDDDYDDEEEEEEYEVSVAKEILQWVMGQFRHLSPQQRHLVLSSAKQSAVNIRNETPENIPPYLRIMSLPDDVISPIMKRSLLQQWEESESVGSGSGENKKRTFLDQVALLPLGNYASSDLTKGGQKSVQDVIVEAKDILDSFCFGMQDVKHMLLQFLTSYITNPSKNGNCLLLKGPMGTGKTSIVRNGLTKIMDRPFVFIPLGGTSDVTSLVGSDFVYNGSQPGLIAKGLMSSKVMNPIFYFDEVDKIGNGHSLEDYSFSKSGDERNSAGGGISPLMSVLMAITDFSQNRQFRDHFFGDIHLDLSKCLFIFSCNTEKSIHPILLDRLTLLETKGYNPTDMMWILESFLIPRFVEKYRLLSYDIQIQKDVIDFMIRQNTSAGVRPLEQQLDILFSAIHFFIHVPILAKQRWKCMENWSVDKPITSFIYRELFQASNTSLMNSGNKLSAAALSMYN